MKKTVYIGVALIGMGVLGACNGHKDYEQYVATLKAQPAIIDTLSTPQSYAMYIEDFKAMTDSFTSIGVKLNPTQIDEIAALNREIEQHARDRYAVLTAAMSPEAPTDSID